METVINQTRKLPFHPSAHSTAFTELFKAEQGMRPDASKIEAKSHERGCGSWRGGSEPLPHQLEGPFQ